MLLFSSQDNMPSGQLTNPFRNMSLDSQQPSQDRPPVPRFSDGSGNGNGMVSSSQLDMEYGTQTEALGTPDFITPVDQFGLDCDPATKQTRAMRSPAQLSPSRQKRARPSVIQGAHMGAVRG